MIERQIITSIIESLKDFPGVLLNGARQTGKSTIAELLRDNGLIDNYATLDDLENLESAKNNPDGFINQFTGSLAIDEVQRTPDLLRAIKKSIDQNKKPGRFLLTGSANLLSYPGVTESLAGRVDIISLEGLSLGEILSPTSPPSTFINDLFSGSDLQTLSKKWNQTLKEKPELPKPTLLETLFYGGYPEVALKKSLRFRNHWFSSYQSAYIERDVRNLSRLLDVTAFATLYKILGLRTGNLLNISNVANQVKLDVRTVNRYLEILEITFQISLLKPWFSNDEKKFVKSPKIYLKDSGQAAFLWGINDPDHLASHPALGAIFETWVLAELRKLIALTHNVDTHFYRTYDGHEVDFLLSRGNTYWGIECKWSEHVSLDDFKGLTKMTQTLPGTPQGIVLYTGQNIVPIEKNLIAVPIRLLS